MVNSPPSSKKGTLSSGSRTTDNTFKASRPASISNQSGFTHNKTNEATDKTVNGKVNGTSSKSISWSLDNNMNETKMGEDQVDKGNDPSYAESWSLQPVTNMPGSLSFSGFPSFPVNQTNFSRAFFGNNGHRGLWGFPLPQFSGIPDWSHRSRSLGSSFGSQGFSSGGVSGIGQGFSSGGVSGIGQGFSSGGVSGIGQGFSSGGVLGIGQGFSSERVSRIGQDFSSGGVSGIGQDFSSGGVSGIGQGFSSGGVSGIGQGFSSGGVSGIGQGFSSSQGNQEFSTGSHSSSFQTSFYLSSTSGQAYSDSANRVSEEKVVPIEIEKTDQGQQVSDVMKKFTRTTCIRPQSSTTIIDQVQKDIKPKVSRKYLAKASLPLKRKVISTPIMERAVKETVHVTKLADLQKSPSKSSKYTSYSYLNLNKPKKTKRIAFSRRVSFAPTTSTTKHERLSQSKVTGKGGGARITREKSVLVKPLARKYEMMLASGGSSSGVSSDEEGSFGSRKIEGEFTQSYSSGSEYSEPKVRQTTTKSIFLHPAGSESDNTDSRLVDTHFSFSGQSDTKSPTVKSQTKKSVYLYPINSRSRPTTKTYGKSSIFIVPKFKRRRVVSKTFQIGPSLGANISSSNTCRGRHVGDACSP